MSKYNEAYIRERLGRYIIFAKSGCWLFKGHKYNGYGNFQGHRVHRLVYEIYRGPIPEGMFVCHHCDVPNCCNPKHLFLGTPKDNVDDMIRKNRQNYACKL